MRLQKYMAACNVASRRKCEEMIADGRVSVDGETITQPGMKIGVNNVVKVDDRTVSLSNKKVYIILNKPEGYLSTVTDDFGRKTVMDLVKDTSERLYPVGRLDKDTTGLLLLTNDGDFHYHMTHPSHEIDKEYIAGINGRINSDTIKAFNKGFFMDGSITAPAKISEMSFNEKFSVVKIVIHEGKKRQVKRMLKECGFNTLFLQRTRIGDIMLGDLPVGKWRYLSSKELKSIGFNV